MPRAPARTSGISSRLPAEPEQDFVLVGRVGRPHGLDGAFVVEHASEDASRFAVGATLIVEGEPATVVLSRRVGAGPARDQARSPGRARSRAARTAPRSPAARGGVVLRHRPRRPRSAGGRGRATRHGRRRPPRRRERRARARHRNLAAARRRLRAGGRSRAPAGFSSRLVSQATGNLVSPCASTSSR